MSMNRTDPFVSGSVASVTQFTRSAEASMRQVVFDEPESKRETLLSGSLLNDVNSNRAGPRRYTVPAFRLPPADVVP